MLTENGLYRKIHALSIGYSEVVYLNKKYSVTRRDFNGGKSIKVFAQELGGKDFISFNFYMTLKDGLKPCEMSSDKVVNFLDGYESCK